MKRILAIATAAMMAVFSAQAQIKRSDEFRAKYELKEVVVMSRHNIRSPLTSGGAPIPISAKQRILPSITTNGASARFLAGDSDAFASSYLMTTFFPFRMYIPGRNG